MDAHGSGKLLHCISHFNLQSKHHITFNIIDRNENFNLLSFQASQEPGISKYFSIQSIALGVIGMGVPPQTHLTSVKSMYSTFCQPEKNKISHDRLTFQN